ncbi:MAG: AbrB/MazE/SpoVT family DNA-binding domain-containing protein [Rhodoferax sp.]
MSKQREVGTAEWNAHITLAERGQSVIPKEARDALGLKPGAKLQMRIQDGQLLIEKRWPLT